MSYDPAAAQKARDFLALSRQAFGSKYADSARIGEVEDRLRQAIREAQPIKPAVENLLNQQLRNSIANTLARGQNPAASPAAIAQINYQTAYASLEHLVGLRALAREPSLSLSDRHRALLVEAARTNTIGDKDVRLPIAPQRAKEIAAQLAAVDSREHGNPFGEGPLRAAYDQQRAPAAPTPTGGRGR